MEKRWTIGLSFQASLTAGKLVDEASTTVNFLGSAGSKQDYYNRRGDKSVSAQDVSCQFVVSFGYERPFGSHRRFCRSVEALQ